MPRLFFALRTSEQQRNELRRVQLELASDLDKLHANYRLENIQNSHCTVRFLGNVDASVVNQLVEVTRTEIEKTNVTPFELSLDACGTFANRERTKVMWTGLTNAPELLELRKAIDSALALANIPVEPSEDFHPHLTLVRFREPFRLPVDFQLPEVSAIAARVTDIELIESKTLPSGAVHEVIARFVL